MLNNMLNPTRRASAEAAMARLPIDVLRPVTERYTLYLEHFVEIMEQKSLDDDELACEHDHTA